MSVNGMLSLFSFCDVTVDQFVGCNDRIRIELPPFSLIRNFGKQNTHRNISIISVNLTCY